MNAKTKQQQAATQDAQVLPLHQLYTSLLCQLFQADGLDIVQQDLPATDKALQNGRLFAVTRGGTRPAIVCSYSFGIDALTLDVAVAVDGRTFKREVSYFQGLDDVGAELLKFLRAGRLAAPRAA